MEYIGERAIKNVQKTDEKTDGGVRILRVEYEDGESECFSELMYSVVVSEEPCDLTALREKRIKPVVEALLVILRDWGIKLGELPYMSLVLNSSLDYNGKEALNELWSQWMPKPKSPDDVDLIAIDRVLKSKKKTLNDIL